LNPENVLCSHEDPFVDSLRGYLTSAVSALSTSGLNVEAAWLDPYDPRDATIRLARSKALVFDEVSGWRYGNFVSGRQGFRTVLDNVAYVGGGVLPDLHELTHRVINGASIPRPVYRSFADLHDGFEDALRRRGNS
jgi:hypothetical protein